MVGLELVAGGDTAIIKPGSLRPAVASGLTIDDFTADEPGGTVSCPEGVTRPITPLRYVSFAAACRGCPLRERCTASPAGRTLRLRPHDALLRQARHDWAGGQQFRDTHLQHWPMVERSIAWLTCPRSRRRKLRYHTSPTATIGCTCGLPA